MKIIKNVDGKYLVKEGRHYYSDIETAISCKKADLKAERRHKFNKDEFKFFTALLGGISGFGVTLVGGVISNDAENAARKQAYSDSIRPELDAKAAEYVAILKERYPQLDTSNWDSTNIVQNLRQAYYNSFTKDPSLNIFQNDSVIIKDVDIYVDWRNGNLNFVREGLNSLASGYDHYPLLDSIKDMIPVGVGAVALSALIVLAPTIHHKLKAKKIDKQITRLENELAQKLEA